MDIINTGLVLGGICKFVNIAGDSVRFASRRPVGVMTGRIVGLRIIYITNLTRNQWAAM